MPTRTRFVFLMHPKEFKHEKAATGRLTHLCLPNSTLQMGVNFDEHAAVRELLADPRNYCCLLYPGPTALNLSTESATAPPSPALAALQSAIISGQQLVVFLLDATWALGRKMLRLSPTLQRLPRLMFTPTTPSRYVIKQQPHPACLSTLEATHELLLVLERTNLDTYPKPKQLIALFDRMQDYQLKCASDPARAGYRRHAYKPPTARKPTSGNSGARRTAMFRNLGSPT